MGGTHRVEHTRPTSGGGHWKALPMLRAIRASGGGREATMTPEVAADGEVFVAYAQQCLAIHTVATP